MSLFSKLRWTTAPVPSTPQVYTRVPIRIAEPVVERESSQKQPTGTSSMDKDTSSTPLLVKPLALQRMMDQTQAILQFTSDSEGALTQLFVYDPSPMLLESYAGRKILHSEPTDPEDGDLIYFEETLYVFHAGEDAWVKVVMT